MTGRDAGEVGAEKVEAGEVRAEEVRAEEVQAELARLRADVLGGRGPGAGQTEVLEHTRARTEVGGRPVVELRQALADDTARARRDPDQLALVVAADRSRLAARVAAVRVGVDAPDGPAAPRRRPVVLRLLGRVLAGR